MSYRQTLAEFIGSKRGAAAAFARKAGVSPQQVSNVLKARRAPSEAEAESYATIIGLDGEARADFLRSAASDRSRYKGDVAPYVAELENQLHGSNEKLKATLAALADLLALAQQEGRQIPQQLVDRVDSLRKDLDG